MEEMHIIDRHQTPLRDTQYQFVGEIDWGEPRQSKWVRAVLIVLGSGLGWGLVIGALLIALVAAHGLVAP